MIGLTGFLFHLFLHNRLPSAFCFACFRLWVCVSEVVLWTRSLASNLGFRKNNTHTPESPPGTAKNPKALESARVRKPLNWSPGPKPPAHPSSPENL